MSDKIIFISTVLGVIIAWLTYTAPNKEVKELRTITLEKFYLLKRINSELISFMTEFGIHHNYFDQEFMQGLTLKQCISILSEVRTGLLTDENYKALQKAKQKNRIISIKENLDIQIKHHSEIQTVIKLYLKPHL